MLHTFGCDVEDAEVVEREVAQAESIQRASLEAPSILYSRYLGEVKIDRADGVERFSYSPVVW